LRWDNRFWSITRPGVISVEAAAKAAPDGYTLLMTAQSMWISPLLGTKVSYSASADFVPVSWAAAQHNVLIVHPSLPVRSVKDLIALAKARPGELNYASGPDGGGPHLSGELFKSMAGVSIMRVPYKGTAQALTDLISGSVQLMFAPAAVMTHVRAGRLQALGVTSAGPSALAPGLPPIAASLPGYQTGGVAAIFAPTGTPAPIVERLNQEIVRVLNTQDVREKLFNNGIETIGSSSQELATMMKSDLASMGKLIKQAGIRGE
jgi:tripartite-type tricarboxylate transporter receptor subunit TctC